jgi:hypothetical protein
VKVHGLEEIISHEQERDREILDRLAQQDRQLLLILDVFARRDMEILDKITTWERQEMMTNYDYD